ncbi:MAG: hypothetical protein ACR2PS_00185 [Pseudomonadales bacterium]
MPLLIPPRIHKVIISCLLVILFLMGQLAYGQAGSAPWLAGYNVGSPLPPNPAQTTPVWWQFDFGSQKLVQDLQFANRSACCADQFVDFYLLLSDSAINVMTLAEAVASPEVQAVYVAGGFDAVGQLAVPVAMRGRYLRIQPIANYLSMASAQVFGSDPDGDTDSDGVNDGDDAFPYDPGEWQDSDADGVGDNGDAYPNDPTRWEISPQLVSGSLSNVGDVWQTITLAQNYSEMVVVATAQYDASQSPVITRVRNASGNQFEIKVQNPADLPASGYTVQYTVAEAGVYSQTQHGVSMEAATFQSTTTDDNNAWAGEARNYQNTYTSPVVLGQVMSDNDPRWSVFWASNGSTANPPSALALNIGKHVGEDPVTARANELLGYIVIEAGVAELNGKTVQAGLGADTVGGISNNPAYEYSLSVNVDNAVLSSAGMDGVNGGWPVLYGTSGVSGNSLGIAIDEDQLFDSERSHTTEQVAFLIFGTAIPGPPVSSHQPKLQTGVLSNVSDAWQLVTLPDTYSDMVVVASAQYDAGMAPAVTRVRNANGNQFELRVQNPAGQSLLNYGVQYLVVEAGNYSLADHGVNMEARKFISSVTDQNNSWLGQAVHYSQSFTAPVVVGQVMTANDSDWSMFWASNGVTTSPPTSSSLYVGKHVAEDSDATRADETLGYVVIEAGNGAVNGLQYNAGLGTDSVLGFTDNPAYNYTVTGTPQSAVVSSAGMDGGNGGWPVLYGPAPLAGGSLSLAIDEDQIGDAERNHTTEQVSFIVFEAP